MLNIAITREEKLVELFDSVKFYVGSQLSDLNEIARNFIESYENDKKLPWKSTPPAWLEDAVYNILDRK